MTLFMLWGGYHTNRGLKERNAERVLRTRHTSLMYGPQHERSGLLGKIALLYRKVVQTLWRERYISHVAINDPLDAEVVAAITTLPHLESLSLCSHELSAEERDRQYEQKKFTPRVRMPPGAIQRILEAQPDLTALACNAWILSDDDCRAIANLSSLEHLSINLSNCSETGFAMLLRAPKLRHMTFTYSNVTGTALSDQPGAQSLEWITCDYSPVSQEFGAYLARSPKLTTLQALGCPIGDEFVSELNAHPSLTNLSIPFSRITHASFEHIMQMPALQIAQLPKTAVSKLDAEEAHKKRPSLTIARH